MFEFNIFNSKKKIALIALIIFSLLLILSKNYISDVIKQPAFKVQLINIARVVVPLKDFILLKNIDERIALLKSSGSCSFCDLTQGDFKGGDFKGVNLRYANLNGSNLSNVNLSGANLTGVDLTNLDLTAVNLSRVDLNNKDLTGAILLEANLSGANLMGADFSNQDLTGVVFLNAILSGVNLTGVDLANLDLTAVNLSGVDLSNKDLTGTILSGTIFSGANLTGVDLTNLDLTAVNLSGVDLSNKDLTGTILSFATLSGANLDGVDLRNKDLTGVNLSRLDLSNMDLTGTILKDAKQIEISVNPPSNLNWTVFSEENLNVSRYDLRGDLNLIATKEGFLFEIINNELRLVLDLNKDAQFPLIKEIDAGLLGVASKNNLIYVSYATKIDHEIFLVVDEYSSDFSKVRNIIKIGGFNIGIHFGGALQFDSFGKLYLSTGDGSSNAAYEDHPQNLNDYRGKILRLDTSDLKLEPEVVAYGIRTPWGMTIDSKDRMFISQCGNSTAETVYYLNDLYSGIPVNLGWPVFEGSKRNSNDSLMFKNVLAPIFETNIRPGCMTAGVYLDNLELFVSGDFFGMIRLLKQKEDGSWYLLHEYKQDYFIWGFDLYKNSNIILIAPGNYELEIFIDQVNEN